MKGLRRNVEVGWEGSGEWRGEKHGEKGEQVRIISMGST